MAQGSLFGSCLFGYTDQVKQLIEEGTNLEEKDEV